MATFTRSFTPKQKGKQVTDEAGLKFQKALGRHKREEALLNWVNGLAILLVFLFAAGIIAWMITLAVHYIQTNNWDAFERRGDIIATAIIAYLISYLQSHGIRREKEE